MKIKRADLAVVGGGASGLTAALAAARKAGRAGKRISVVLLEKNPRVGKKLLLTGNGRCNLSNRDADPAHYHGGPGAAVVLERHPPDRVEKAFRELGLLCRELDGGRVYPYSLQATSVLNVLRRNLGHAGAEEICDFSVEKIRAEDGGFLLASGTGTLSARAVVLACGGRACPQSGSAGDGYALARALGHTVTPLFPSLVQIRTDPARVRALKGVRCPAEAAFLSDGHALRRTRGEVQFADAALSGICVFELSRCLGEIGASKRAEISLDLMPEYGAQEIESLLSDAAGTAPELPAARLTEGMLPKALGAELAKYALGSASAPAASLSRGELSGLAAAVKDFRFPALGTLSWERAQVTAGGVPLDELGENLESKKRPGLFLCGELLDADGDCGGYNLRWAWASGLTAGEAAADFVTGARKENRT